MGDDDDEDDDGLMTELGMPHSTGGDQTPTGDGASTPTRRAAPPAMSLMDVGRGGGRPIGGPKQDGPKDHAYEIVDGEAKARVYDTQVRGWLEHRQCLAGFGCSALWLLICEDGFGIPAHGWRVIVAHMRVRSGIDCHVVCPA